MKTEYWLLKEVEKYWPKLARSTGETDGDYLQVQLVEGLSWIHKEKLIAHELLIKQTGDISVLRKHEIKSYEGEIKFIRYNQRYASPYFREKYNAPEYFERIFNLTKFIGGLLKDIRLNNQEKWFWELERYEEQKRAGDWFNNPLPYRPQNRPMQLRLFDQV